MNHADDNRFVSIESSLTLTSIQQPTKASMVAIT